MDGLVQPPTAVEAPRFRPSSQADLAQSGPRRRIRNNLEALRLLRELEQHQRPATAEQQQVLARWSGWGAVPKIFDDRKSDFAAERSELLELLSPQEYEQAQTNTLNAHYTDFSLVEGIWQGMRELGFDGGNVLEPGCGAGNFIGATPADTSSPTRMVGVEVDPTTAAIARYLYPDAQVLGESFAETVAPQGAFDSVVGNVPFGNYWLYDPRYNPSQEAIHNHFISKSVQMTKPGGVVAVITSRWTMDAEDSSVRQRLVEQADLLGAFRLPRDAHLAAAGTKVVTDVLFLRRREAGQEPTRTDWIKAPVEIEGEAGTAKVNPYFLAHPDHVLGTLGVRLGQFGPEVDVAPAAPDLGEAFTDAVTSLATQARRHGLTISPPAPEWEPLTLAGAEQARLDGLMQIDDQDRLTRVTDGVRTEIDPPVKSRAQELFALLRLRDTYLDLVAAQRDRPVGDEHVEHLRADLNTRYDAYVAAYGPINRFGYKSNGQRNYPNLGGMRQDLMASRVLALENFNPDTQQTRKADIFTQRTVAPAESPESAATAADALAISLDQYNEVRLEHIQHLLQAQSPEQARQALGTLVYTEPVTERLVPAPEYLSGDVRAKLEAARAAAAADERFAVNVEALTEVIPPDLTPAEIEPRLGAAWISADYVQQFAQELLESPGVAVENGGGSLWSVSGGNPKSVLASQTWGTSRLPAQVLLQNILQNKAARVTDTVEDNEGNRRTVLNQAATEAAQAKVEEITDRFASWAWEEPDRARDLAHTYNATFNRLALRTYTGQHLTFPGMAEFDPREHQRTAVARVLAEPATLLAHGVGAGKTAEMVISVMEMRRLGQARKPAVVVPNHMLEQFSREFAELYPQANILVADKDMMSADYRARFADMAASGDWNAIIFGHTQFKNLPLSNAERQAYEDRQVAEYEDWIASAEADPDVSERTVKQLAKAKVQLQNRFKKVAGQVDGGSATLEDCGIDAVIVDEAHEHKNAMVRSNIQDAAKENPSWQAEDLMMKGDYIRKIGGKLVFSTATPVANSVAEAYVITRFLRPDLLHAAGIHDFDQWASTFGEITTDFEMKPEGGGFQQKDRFSRFTNVPELLRIFHTFADVKLSQDLGLDLPHVVGVDEHGQQAQGRQTVVVPASDQLTDFMKELSERAGAVRNGDPQEFWSKSKQAYRPDNMLWISGDGRSAALDPRLVGGEPAEHSKIQAVADQVHQIWEQHKDDVYHDPDTGQAEPRHGALQMVFCDLGTPTQDAERYDAYADLREQLIAQGVPREQVRFVHEAANDKQKAELFASCRDGRTQVIIGSTKKMGTGTNMQRRAVALHHVDCPWRPVDVEQREGRLVRQGNAHTRVRILSYVTEGSFDAYMWQTALRKIRFIEQLMRGTLDMREIEDISSNALSYAEVQALASGNPLMLERAVNEKLVKKLERARTNHYQSQEVLRRTVTAGQAEEASAQAAAAVFDRALHQRVPTRGEAFTMTVGGDTYTKRTEAADALRSVLGSQIRQVRDDPSRMMAGHAFSVGHLAGFDLTAEVYSAGGGEVRTVLSFTDLPSNNPAAGQYGRTPTTAYTFKTVQELATSTGHGLVMSLEHALRELEAGRDQAAAAVPRIQAEIERAQAGLGQPFARQEELDQALAEEARIRTAMGMPQRTTALHGEEHQVSVPGLEEQVSDAETANAVPALGAVSETASQPSTKASQEQQHEYGQDTPPNARPLGAWRSETSTQEQLEAHERSRPPEPAEQEAAPIPPVDPEGSEQSLSQSEEQPSAPKSADPRTADHSPTASGPAHEPERSEAEAEPSPQEPKPTQEPASSTHQAPSAEPPHQESTSPRSRDEKDSFTELDTTELAQEAQDIIGWFTANEEERPDRPAQLRDRLDTALEELLLRGQYESVAELVRAANRMDPTYTADREEFRSRADFATPTTRAQALDQALVRIEEDFAPGGTGMIHNLHNQTGPGSEPEFFEHLLQTLNAEGFEVDETAGQALLLNGDPDQRQQAWSRVLQQLDRYEEFLGGQSVRMTEAQWQAGLRENPRHEPGNDLDHSPEASQEEQPQKPPQQDPANEPLAHASRAVQRLDASFDPQTRTDERASIHGSIDYLVYIDRPQDALHVIDEANRVDPAGAWSREQQRSQLLWQGTDAEERARTGSLIRIEHDGAQNTVVRDTDKDDHQVRDLLKDLKFRWSRRQQFWYLNSKLNAPEQARRVSQLLTGLERLGRDRIAEPIWQHIGEREQQRQRQEADSAIEQLRPTVDEFMRQARQEGTYRSSLVGIEDVHRQLRHQGHIALGQAPGTTWKPFDGQHEELLGAARERTRQILDRFHALMSRSDPDLEAATVLYEELALTAPDRDLPDSKLELVQARLERQRQEQQATEEQEEASEQDGQKPVDPESALTPQETIQDQSEHPQERTGQSPPPAYDSEERPTQAADTAPNGTSEEDLWRQIVDRHIQHAHLTGSYRTALTMIRTIQQTAQESAGSADRPPFEEEHRALLAQAREQVQHVLQRLGRATDGPEADLRAALGLVHELGRATPEEDIAHEELESSLDALYTRMRHQTAQTQDRHDKAQDERAFEPPDETEREPDLYDEAPDDLDSEDPQEGLPHHAHPMPPHRPSLRSSINISGAEPYPDQTSADRASWWIGQHGLNQWQATMTATELSQSRTLPPDDTIALDHAMHQVATDPLRGGAGPAAHRYADLSGAATAVHQRITTDLLHLQHATQLAQEHSQRLAATRHYNLARMRGASSAQLARIDDKQTWVRYTSAEDAAEGSRALATVLGRWAQTSTAQQMRTSTAPGTDVARLRQLWSQVADGGLAGGPGPSSMRFSGMAQAMGELHQRLAGETGHLQNLGQYAMRHAARLASTEQALATQGAAPHQRESEAARGHPARTAPGQQPELGL